MKKFSKLIFFILPGLLEPSSGVQAECVTQDCQESTSQAAMMSATQQAADQARRTEFDQIATGNAAALAAIRRNPPAPAYVYPAAPPVNWSMYMGTHGSGAALSSPGYYWYVPSMWRPHPW